MLRYLLNVVLEMLNKNAKERISLMEILDHECLRKVCEKTGKKESTEEISKFEMYSNIN